MLRQKYNLTQKEVATKLNIRQNTYSQYETGARELPIALLIELARLFETSVDYLLDLTDKEEPYPRSVF